MLAQTREHGASLVLVTHSDAAAARADRVLRLTADGIQAQVEHQQVRLACARLGQAALRRAGFMHLPSFGLQRAADEAADLRFVFNDDGDRC
jgi:ABC-type nitrate/sulfonate/bicarbonate transport system ATPase subunit